MAAGLKSDNVDLVLNATGSGTDVVFKHNGVEIAKASQMIGVGQTWVDETANRASGTTYTNTSGKPILISIQINQVNPVKLDVTIDGSIVIANRGYSASGGDGSSLVQAIIPNNSTYSANSFTQWFELK